MDKIREQLHNPIATAIAGFVVGLIIGLPILGWGLWPVKWIDAEPSHLRADLQQDYLCTTIDSFVRTQNSVDAKARFELLGEDAEDLLDSMKPGTCALNENDLNTFRAAVLGPTIPKPSGTSEAETDGKEKSSSSWGLAIGLLLATLVVGGVLVYLLVYRKRSFLTPEETTSDAHDFERPRERNEYPPEAQEAPIAQYMTTYMIGDDLYDDSFSIDSPSGEFLGECGVGISETIGVGDPKKVTAFEVWLFDKNDIQTVTKVLMTPHAFNDPTILQRLSSKGDPVELRPEERILLETATLQLEARVVDMSLGGGALPENSYFERLTLELAVWPKA
jgi:hypothetical protein